MLKEWSSIEASRDLAESVMMGVSEESYNSPTIEYVHRREGPMNLELIITCKIYAEVIEDAWPPFPVYDA